MIESDGRRLGASYVNFLLVNGAVLLPVYGDAEADEQAITAMAKACPDRAIVPINCRALIEQNGSLHCITMQIPEEVAPRES
jgi:agmatine/peptidylarginine deiminase